MEQKYQRIALIVCLALFIAGCLFSGLFSRSDSSEWDDTGVSRIVISEILPSNRTYPTPDGQHLDFIEIHNLSADTVDISGFMLSDDLSSIGYTFPDGTVLPPYGYAVCWCLPNSEDDAYASFGISREGGETVYLYNHANVLIDEKFVPATAVNTALIRLSQAVWAESSFATPGYPNTEEGYAQWLQTVTGGDLTVAITEVMTDNSCVTSAPGQMPCDWVELTNFGTAPADLSGAYLSNDPADPLKWQISDLIIDPGACAVVYCAGSQAAPGQAPFALSKTGCTVILTGALGNTLSQVDCPALLTDHTWSQNAGGSYQITDAPTPGFENSEAGYSAWMERVGAFRSQVVISEVMTSNRSTVLSAAGMLCDWVELTNYGSTAVTLDGAYLSDDPAERGKWRIGSLTLEAGQSAVIPCVGADAAEGEATFALSRSGCNLILSGSAGNIISQVKCPILDNDRAWALQNNGIYCQTDMPTPGLPNTEESYLAYLAGRNPLGALAITEVMPSNDSYLIQADGRYYDWVELTNISGSAVNLADYALSDDPDDLYAFPLPRYTLDPGERIVIICSARDDLVGKQIHAPFTLGADECWVYLSHADGFSDYLRISDVPTGCSMGRGEDGGLCYFEQPTPGRANGAGSPLIAPTPEALTAPGVYEGVSSLSVEVTGAGTLRYTTDGRIPTEEDPVYTDPLTLTSTTTLRVASFVEGKLKSDVLTANYVINEGHSLPVLCLTADPEALLGQGGIYHQNLPYDEEILCNLSLFEGSGSFCLDGGLEMMATNTAYPGKKNMKVNFRGQYGADVLGYPLFGQDGPLVFDALCLQAGPEQAMTLFRDELFTQLCLELTDAVPTQHSKFCVLYINGQYHGIYSLKEDIGQMLYAQSMEVAESLVTVAEGPAPWGSELYELATYCDENDLSDPECYDYLASRVDMDNLMDWMILQGYCGNDSVANDLYYFTTPETGGRWQLGFFDLDGGFTSRTGFEPVLTELQPYAYLRFTRAIADNPAARQEFLDRLSSALDSTLDSSHVLALIDGFEARLSPEISRERNRWGGSETDWQADVDRLRSYLTRYDHEALLVQSLKQHMALTDEEAALLGGR